MLVHCAALSCQEWWNTFIKAWVSGLYWRDAHAVFLHLGGLQRWVPASEPQTSTTSPGNTKRSRNTTRLILQPVWTHLYSSHSLHFFFCNICLCATRLPPGALSCRGKPRIWSDSGSVRDLKWLQQHPESNQRVTWAWDCRRSSGLLFYLNWLLTKKQPHAHGSFLISKYKGLNLTQFQLSEAANFML